MNIRILTTVSVFALAIPTATLADTSDRIPDVPTVTQEDVKEGWEETKETVSEATEAASDMIEGAVIKIREALIDNETAVTGVHFVNYHPNHTAESIIGSPIQDSAGNTVGNVEDILIDEHGVAHYFILGDGRILSFGDKKVAFEFQKLASKSASGAIVAPITEDLIDKKETYDPSKHKGYSLVKMLDGEVLGSHGKAMASIDNILLQNGRVTHIVAGFDKVLGLGGGENAALPYGIGTIAVQDNETDIVLNSFETASFQTFQSAVSN